MKPGFKTLPPRRLQDVVRVARGVAYERGRINHWNGLRRRVGYMKCVPGLIHRNRGWSKRRQRVNGKFLFLAFGPFARAFGVGGGNHHHVPFFSLDNVAVVAAASLGPLAIHQQKTKGHHQGDSQISAGVEEGRHLDRFQKENKSNINIGFEPCKCFSPTFPRIFPGIQ